MPNIWNSIIGVIQVIVHETLLPVRGLATLLDNVIVETLNCVIF